MIGVDGAQIADPSHIGNLNPFRYRSYYYDVETKLYFLKTRYYDPEICRFITIDDISYLNSDTINGLNLYAYCENDPINKYDPSGHFVISVSFLVGSILWGIVFGMGISGAVAYAEGERGLDLFWDIVGGAILGAAVGATVALGGAAGLASVGVKFALGASVTTLKVSMGAAFGIAIGGTAFASATKYSLDCAASERQWNLRGYLVESVQGAIQGAATFFIAFVGGKSGLFNKFGNFSTEADFYINHGGMNVLRAVFLGSKVLIGETLSKTVFVSGLGGLVRLIIDTLIPEF